MKKNILLLTLAAIAHEANRHYCLSIGDTSQPTWDNAPDWQRESAIKGIEGALAGNTPQQQHESWMAVKVADGWIYGEVKDPEAKTHPCMVPYHELPEEQQRKDHLYAAVVKAAYSALAVELGEADSRCASRTRAKFRVEGITPYTAGGGTVILSPVYSTDPNHENKAFWDATPNGSISLGINNPSAFAAFEQGAEYYVDFTRAE